MDIDSKAVNRRLYVEFLKSNCHYHLYAMGTEFIFALNQSQ